MRKVDDGKKEKRKEKKRKEKREKRMAFLVATTSLPAVYRPNGYDRTTTAGTPHARANMSQLSPLDLDILPFPATSITVRKHQYFFHLQGNQGHDRANKKTEKLMKLTKAFWDLQK